MKKGFTLIELMIVVAIIGILSMIALPSYQDYTKRTYVSEGLALSSAVKLAATETYATTGSWPIRNSEAGLPDGHNITGQAVQSIWLSSLSLTNMTTSHILIFFNQKVVANPNRLPTTDPSSQGNNYLSIYPSSMDTANSGSITWSCLYKGSGIKHRWLPAPCRGTAVEYDG